MTSQSDDEVEVFTRKIKKLRDITGDLNSIIESQNNRMKGLNPQIGSMLGRLQGMISKVGNVDSKRFSGWKYYFLTTFLIIFLLILFFVIF